MSLDQPTTFQSLKPSAQGPYGEVLVADDDIMFRRILQHWLESWGYHTVLAEDGVAAWSILQREHPPELLILDWVMPGIEGPELCRRIREQPRSPYQYILLATGKGDKQDVVRGLEAGADDYLTKPFDRNELRARLSVGRRILTLQQDLINARDTLQFQATHDVLTGIWNRGSVLDQLQRELERAKRAHTSTSLLMLDLDHFKKINDTLGHLTGDAVLKEVAKRIAHSVRAYDLVGRYGGEEFLVVLPGCDQTQVEQNANRIRLAIASAPVVSGSSEIAVTASIGATSVTDEVASSEQEMLLVADRALYEAKNSGRNRVVVL